LTKHAPDEALLRGHADLEEVKVSLPDLLEASARALCSAGAEAVGAESTVDAARVGAEVDVVDVEPKKLEKHMPKLYDLEPRCGTEKSLNVDLDVELYQMENW
jgi:hypothetical protein